MWCWRPPQIRHHQGRDVVVASPTRVRSHVPFVSTYTIVTNYNGPLAAVIARIEDATKINDAK